MKKILVHIIALLSFQMVLSQGVHMNLTGDATEVDGWSNRIDLVNGANKTGGAWYPQSFNLDSAFYLDLMVNFGSLGAEGLAIVLHTDSIPVGAGAEQLGVPNSSNTFVFEFDLQQNGTTTDAIAPHASFFNDGSLIHQSSALLKDASLSPGLYDNESIRINWIPETQTFEVKRIGCTNSSLYYTGDIKNTIFEGNSSVFLGFTAATSAVSDTINLLLQKNSVGISEDKTICQGEEIQLYTYNGVASNWSSNEPFSWTTMEMIVAQPINTTYYTVTHTGPCGVTEDSILVTVLDTAIVNTVIDYDPNTNYANVQLDITGGTLPVSHYWVFPDATIDYQQHLISVLPGTYGLVITSGGQCRIDKSVEVLATSLSEQDFFSPNGDGEGEGIKITIEGKSEIVNGGGQTIKEVYEGEVWDGTNKSGVLQPSGVYLIIGDSGVQTITLLR